MKYRVCRKGDGVILARGLSMRDARAAAIELTVATKRKYVVRQDIGPVERINVEQ